MVAIASLVTHQTVRSGNGPNCCLTFKIDVYKLYFNR